LRNDSKFFTILINPLAFKVKLFSGTPERQHVLAFNTNYSWLGQPIGIQKSENRMGISIPAKSDVRPCLCVKDGFASILYPYSKHFDVDKYPLITQAGPLLVEYKRPVFEKTIKKEGFRSDAVRKTRHVAAGVTRVGKIVAIYAHNASMSDLSEELIKNKALMGMKMDGGHLAFMSYQLWEHDYIVDKDILAEDYHFGPNKVPKGIQFLPK
jgi:hypothetical protein